MIRKKSDNEESQEANTKSETRSPSTIIKKENDTELECFFESLTPLDDLVVVSSDSEEENDVVEGKFIHMNECFNALDQRIDGLEKSINQHFDKMNQTIKNELKEQTILLQTIAKNTAK